MRKRTKPEVVTCTPYMRVRRVRGDTGPRAPLGDAGRGGQASAYHVTSGRRLEELFASICAGSVSTAIGSLPENQGSVHEVSFIPPGSKTSANSIPLLKDSSDEADHSVQDGGNLVVPGGAVGPMYQRPVNTAPQLLHAMNRTNHLQLKKQVSSLSIETRAISNTSKCIDVLP